MLSGYISLRCIPLLGLANETEAVQTKDGKHRGDLIGMRRAGRHRTPKTQQQQQFRISQAPNLTSPLNIPRSIWRAPCITLPAGFLPNVDNHRRDSKTDA